MKVDAAANSTPSNNRQWSVALACVVGAVAVLALLSWWIRKCRHTGRYHYSVLDGPSPFGNATPGQTPGCTTPHTQHQQEHQFLAREYGLDQCSMIYPNDQQSGHCKTRYELLAHLDALGVRQNKHWFLVRDVNIKTERLMTMVPVGETCPIDCSEDSRSVLLQLFGALQHPYIYPVLDLGFAGNRVTLVMPSNAQGSLRDLIYQSNWRNPYSCKYAGRGSDLGLARVQRLGRQILEALLFLEERGLQEHGHLHSGNIVIQNGVARLCGLENSLLGLRPACEENEEACESSDVRNFGKVVFEMCTGHEAPQDGPSAGQLEFDFERYPQVADVLRLIFEPETKQPPTISELLQCELFRNIDLREMRGSSLSILRPASSTKQLLSSVTLRRRRGPGVGGGAGGAGNGGGGSRVIPLCRPGPPGQRSEPSTPQDTPPDTPARREARARSSIDVATLNILDYSSYDQTEIKIEISPEPNAPSITITLADAGLSEL